MLNKLIVISRKVGGNHGRLVSLNGSHHIYSFSLEDNESFFSSVEKTAQHRGIPLEDVDVRDVWEAFVISDVEITAGTASTILL